MDRVRVSQDHTFKKAVFNPEAAVVFNNTLTGTRELLQEVSGHMTSRESHMTEFSSPLQELCMVSYSSQLARIHVEHFLSELLSSTPVPGHQDDASVTGEFLSRGLA